MIFKLFHKIQREASLLNLFFEPSIALIPKLDKYTTKKWKL
jgi:hypothetical protein